MDKVKKKKRRRWGVPDRRSSLRGLTDIKDKRRRSMRAS